MFTNIVGTGQFGNISLHSGYIYQIYDHSRSQEREVDPLSLTASGMLLHPSVGDDIDESVAIQGPQNQVCHGDLAADSVTIRNRLRYLSEGPLSP